MEIVISDSCKTKIFAYILFLLCLRSVQPFCPYNTGTKEQDSELGET